MTRRGFILAVIGCLQAAAVLRHVRTAGRRGPLPRQALGATALTDLFENVEAAVRVGEAYLRTLTADEVPGRLLSGAGIDPRLPWRLRPDTFDRRRREDFLSGNTVLLEGWIMARSELCVCGLIACAQGSRRRG